MCEETGHFLRITRLGKVSLSEAALHTKKKIILHSTSTQAQCHFISSTDNIVLETQDSDG